MGVQFGPAQYPVGKSPKNGGKSVSLATAGRLFPGYAGVGVLPARGYARALDILQGIDPAFVNENPEIAYHLGLVYWALGQTEKARAYVVQAAGGGWKPAQKFRKKHF